MIQTSEEYIEGLGGMKKRIFMFGEEIENYVDHPMIKPSLNAVSMTYHLANDPEYQDLMIAQSNLTGEPVNRFCLLYTSPSPRD